MDVIEEEEEIKEEPEPLLPGQQLMSDLRRAFLYRPSLVNHQSALLVALDIYHWQLIISRHSFLDWNILP